MITPGGWGLFAGWLLKSSAQAALLVVLVLAVQWLLRRWLTPRWRYLLWWLVVARLLMPVSLPGPVSIFNWVRWQTPVAPVPSVAPIAADVPTTTPLPILVPTAGEKTKPALPSATTAPEPTRFATPDAQPTATPERAAARAPLNWRLAVMWLWLAGAALLGARLVWFVLRLRRELRTATPVDDPTVLELLDECRERMRVRERLTLLETPLVNSPALCGFWRPKLLLPPGLCRDFTAQQLRFIFLHELAHVRRRDIAVNWLITLLQLLHWFNPLVWLAFSRLRADRELACDALALSVAAPGEQHAYGQTIIRLLEGFARPSAMPGLVGILEDKSQMKRRIRMIAQFRRPGRWAWLSGIAAAILGIACLTDAQTPKAKDKAVPEASHTTNTASKVIAIGTPGSNEAISTSPTLPSLPSVQGEKAVSKTNRTNPVGTGDRRRELTERLAKIVLPGVEFDSVPLPKVIEELTKQVREQDPQHRGVNILVSDMSNSATPPVVNPTTGLPEPSQIVPGVDITISVRTQEKLSLGQALDLVVQGASHPIRYSVADFGVVFAANGTEPQPLFTRWFKLEPSILPDRLFSFLGEPLDSSPTNTTAALRRFLARARVELDWPKSLEWTEKSGLLMVRATKTDLDRVEEAIQILKRSPEQLDIQVQVCEVAFQDDDLPALGRILGGSLERFSSAKSGSRLTNAVEAALPQVLTEARHNEVMRLLKQRSDVDFITALRATTMSGRQARINIGTNTDAITGQTNLTTGVSVEASVFPDGTTIEVQAAAMMKTFVGYDTAPAHRRQYDYVAPPNIDPDRMHETLPSVIPERPTGSNVPRAPIRNQEPIPIFRLRQTVANATVWDGQTMVLSRMATGSPMESRTGAPATNNLPLVGRLFNSESFGPRNSLVLIFITPTIIDPAGNRVHSDKDLPFARTDVPKQRGISAPEAPGGRDTEPTERSWPEHKLRNATHSGSAVPGAKVEPSAPTERTFAPSNSPAEAAPEVEPPALLTRWWKVDPNTFARTLDELVVVGATNQSRPDSRLVTSRFTNAPSFTGERIRLLFSSLGVDFSPPKNCFFTHGKGMLMVQATQQDLDLIERAIQALNAAAPQVSIEVKFAEVSSDDPDGAAFLDLIGFNSAATNGLSGTAKPMNSSEVTIAIERAVFAARIGNTNGDPVAAKVAQPVFTSILKADQFRAVVQALEKRKGVELLSMPKATTLSGRQAQIKTVEIKYVVTDIDNSSTPDRKPQPIAEPFELGPILDVVPDVSVDLRTIRMIMIPTIKEFLGYDLETGKEFQKATGATSAVPLPKFRLRQVMATANVADGQTVVLSPGAVEVEEKSGGRRGKTTRKHLLIFVTPTLIDPAGNPVHGGNSRP